MTDIVIGSDIALDSTYDIGISQSGDIALISDEADIIQTAINNLYTIFGEMEIQPTRGNKLLASRVKLTESGSALVKSYCTNAILYDIRVRSVVDMNVVRLENNTCNIEFILQLHDDRVIRGNTAINIMN